MEASAEPINERLDGLRAALAGDDQKLIAERLTAAAAPLKPLDLIIHVERWRAVNDVTEHSERFEDNALELLDELYRRHLAT